MKWNVRCENWQKIPLAYSCCHIPKSCFQYIAIRCSLSVLCLAASAMDRNKSNTSLSSLSSEVKVLSSSPLRSVANRRSSRGRRHSTQQVDKSPNTSDENRTKVLRPVNQQQDYITEKTLLLQHAFLLSHQTSYVWHYFYTYCTKNANAYYISALSCHTASCWTQQRSKQEQKYKTEIEAGLRPVLS